MHTHTARILVIGAFTFGMLSLAVWQRTSAVRAQSLSLSQQAYAVLKQNCFGCHGAARTSELDLRTAEGVLAGGENGKVIVPGDALASRLYLFVTQQEKPTMPPGKKLSEADIETLRKWIVAGAPFDGFAPVVTEAAKAVLKDSEARGGGVLRSEYWQLWDSPDGRFPPLEYVVASLDSAFTEKEENDPSALVVFGLELGRPAGSSRKPSCP